MILRSVLAPLGAGRALVLAAAMAAATALCGCNTIGKLSHLGGGKDDAAKAAPGERIPVLASDQVLEAAPALKGVDFALPPPAPLTEWPLPGATPQQSVENVDAAPAFQIAWRRKIGRGDSRVSHVTATPIEAEGKLYVMDGEGEVSALDPATGREVWRANLKPRSGRDREGWGGGLAYSDGLVVVSSGFRVIVGLDAATGREAWRTPVSTPVHGAPNISGGRVFVVDVSDRLLTYDARTGAPGWTYQALEEPARMLVASSPAVDGDLVVSPFASGEVVALSSANGTDLWSDVLSLTNRNSALSEIRDIAGRPVISHGVVYAGSHSGLVGAIEARTGRRIWSLPATTITSPWASGDVVFITEQSGKVICAARESGQVYWISDLNAVPKKKKKPKYGAAWSGPVLADNRLILTSSDGRMVALDPKTGAVGKTLRLGEGAFVSPIAVAGLVYTVGDRGDLVAIR